MKQRQPRILALDYARAWAIFGMIMVNYKLAMQADQGGAAWLHKAAGLFEGRASALFVLLAGFGVSLMTMKARSSLDQELVRQSRNSLYRRAAFLFLSGLLLMATGWNADILHYYAVFMLTAGLLITVRDKTLIRLFVILLIGSQAGLVWFDYSKGWDNGFHRYEDFWTLSGFARNLFFNGFHPASPWLCFFLLGLWLGRKPWFKGDRRLKLLLYSLSGAVLLELISYAFIRWSAPILDSDTAHYLFMTKPMPPTLLYVLSAACTGIAFLVCCFYATEKLAASRWTKWLIHTGQLSLTHYIGHVWLGLGLLEMAGRLENGSLSFAVLYGCGYFIAAVVFSALWRRWLPRGPIELVMRKIG